MKKKRFYIKVIAFLFVFVFIFLSIPFSSFAKSEQKQNVVVKNVIANSTVLDDFEEFGIDYRLYPKNIKAEHCQLLYFLEYGYDELGPSSDYGLYLYVYNPSGREVKPNGNSVQMALKMIDTSTFLEYNKYALQLVSVSNVQGYENVFLKFKLQSVGGFYEKLSAGMRKYDLSGIEIWYQNYRNPIEFGIGSDFTFTGFMQYHDKNRSENSTLQSYVSDIITLDLELHPLTWKTKTSDKGAGYQYEVFSVYFSVPNDIINRYGDKNNYTKGLIRAYGAYEELMINGIVTNTDLIYNTVKKDLGRNDVDWGFVSEGMLYKSSSFIGLEWWREDSFCLNPPASIQHNGSVPVPYICTVFDHEDGKFPGFSVEEFAEKLYALYDQNGGLYVLPESKGYQYYWVEDKDDLSQSIGSFASSHNGFISWLQGYGDLYIKDESYSSIKGIQAVKYDELALLTNLEIAQNYYMQESEADAFRVFTRNEQIKNRTTFILRYAVRDYYCDEASFYMPSTNSLGFGNGDYYFQKTIFMNFDIISLTWQDSYSRVVTIPVVASPVDNLGTVTPPIDAPGALDDPNQKPPSNDDDDFWKKLLRIVLFIICIWFVVWVLGKLGILKPLSKFISSFFDWLFKAIKKLFTFLFGLKKRRKKASEKKELKSDVFDEGGEDP